MKRFFKKIVNFLFRRHPRTSAREYLRRVAEIEKAAGYTQHDIYL